MVGLGLADVALIAWYILVLVVLEGLLSADNALVLAVMVRHLPKKEQRRVLIYGIWGAVLFRVLALCYRRCCCRSGTARSSGGGYLLYLALAHFRPAPRLIRKNHEQMPRRRTKARGSAAFGGQSPRSRWRTSPFPSIRFSQPSAWPTGFPARFGTGGKLFIVFTGGVLGIITMRFVVRYFLILLERFPGLEEGAYYLVAWIGLKLMISGFHSGKFMANTSRFISRSGSSGSSCS